MVEAEEGTEHSSVAKRLKVVRSLLLGQDVGVRDLGVDEFSVDVDVAARKAVAAALVDLASLIERDGFNRSVAAPLLGVPVCLPDSHHGQRLTGVLLDDLLVLLDNVCRAYGVGYRSFACFTPMQLSIYCGEGGEYKHGVLSCVAQVTELLRSSAYGGESLFDFFRKPARQKVQRPGSGGCND